MASRAFDSKIPVGETDLIEKRLEDLFLAVTFLHLARGCLLAQLPAKSSVGSVDNVGVHVADEKLRDRARSPAVSQDVVLDCAGNTYHVDAVVLVEPLILDCNERLRHVCG